jgi:hypothetical protein
MGQSQRLISNWQLLSPLLDEALELPVDRRSAWLDSLGPEHQSLKAELARLLTEATSTNITGIIESA